MFLDSEPEGEIQLPRSGMPLKEKKRTATLLSATEKIYMFLSSSPSVTKGKPFFFSSVKGSVHSQAFTCKSSFDMLICACNTAFILSRNYMHAWHAVPSCKGNKIKNNSNRSMIVKFPLELFFICSLNDKQEFKVSATNQEMIPLVH